MAGICECKKILKNSLEISWMNYRWQVWNSSYTNQSSEWEFLEARKIAILLSRPFLLLYAILYVFSYREFRNLYFLHLLIHFFSPIVGQRFIQFPVNKKIFFLFTSIFGRIPIPLSIQIHSSAIFFVLHIVYSMHTGHSCRISDVKHSRRNKCVFMHSFFVVFLACKSKSDRME